MDLPQIEAHHLITTVDFNMDGLLSKVGKMLTIRLIFALLFQLITIESTIKERSSIDSKKAKKIKTTGIN